MSKKTRTINELLILLRKEVDECDDKKFTGMCGRIDQLRCRFKISKTEMDALYAYLSVNRPDWSHGIGEYWWAKGLKTFRLDWLDVNINDLP